MSELEEDAAVNEQNQALEKQVAKLFSDGERSQEKLDESEVEPNNMVRKSGVPHIHLSCSHNLQCIYLTLLTLTPAVATNGTNSR